jgi:pSer/pThr/pTyr-binding forkhead associated (FHA) protein
LTLPRERDRVLIGRAPGCECRFGEETVSRRHALLLRRQGGWTIEDLGSLNGTLLNGWRVVIPTEVRPGDIVSFGEVACRVAE